MAATTPWYVIEAQVLALINALVTGTVAQSETAYAALPKVNDTDVDDAAFPRIFVRRTIVQSHQQIVGYVCSTDGHPRRLPFRTTATVAHLAALPTTIALIGAVYDAVTGRELTKLEDPSQVTALLADTGSQNGVTQYYYSLKGNTFYTTLSGNATIEVFRYDNPAPLDSQLAALFDATSDLIGLDDEFANPIAWLAAGILAAKAGSFMDSAGMFLGMAEKSLEALQVKTSPNDFSINSAKAA